MKRRRYHLGLETFSQIDIDRGADAVRCVRVRMRVRARMLVRVRGPATAVACAGRPSLTMRGPCGAMRSHACSYRIFWEICVLMGVRAHSTAAAAMRACDYEDER